VSAFGECGFHEGLTPPSLSPLATDVCQQINITGRLNSVWNFTANFNSQCLNRFFRCDAADTLAKSLDRLSEESKIVFGFPQFD